MLVLLAETHNWSDKASGLAWATVWFAVVFAMLACGVAVVKKFQKRGSTSASLHDGNENDSADAGELLTKFRELHSRGTLSDGEYRTIKTKLASQIRSDGGDMP